MAEKSSVYFLLSKTNSILFTEKNCMICTNKNYNIYLPCTALKGHLDRLEFCLQPQLNDCRWGIRSSYIMRLFSKQHNMVLTQYCFVKLVYLYRD